MLVLPMGRIYDVRRLNGLRWHDILTKFRDVLYRHLNNITDITTTIWEAVILVLLTEGIYKAHRWDGLM
jgi:hypothetical protein